MRGRVNCLGLVTLLIVLLLGTAHGHHDDDRPHTLLTGSWVCVSQDVYGKAAAGKRAGKDVQALRQELRNEDGHELCIFVDDEILEDMLAPWVRVLGQEGGQVQVAFTVGVLPASQHHTPAFFARSVHGLDGRQQSRYLYSVTVGGHVNWRESARFSALACWWDGCSLPRAGLTSPGKPFRGPSASTPT